MSFQLEKIRNDLENLNVDFQHKKAFLKSGRDEIYSQLEELFGINTADSILVSWLPEEDSITSGCILDQADNICFFEIYEYNRDESSCEKTPIQKYVSKDFYRKYKDSHPVVVAIALKTGQLGDRSIKGKINGGRLD